MKEDNTSKFLELLEPSTYHTEDSWHLVNSKPQPEFLSKFWWPWPLGNTNSLIIYQCSKSKAADGTLRVVYRGFGTPNTYSQETVHSSCYYCGSKIPKNLKTLWVLHNWKHL